MKIKGNGKINENFKHVYPAIKLKLVKQSNHIAFLITYSRPCKKHIHFTLLLNSCEDAI